MAGSSSLRARPKTSLHQRPRSEQQPNRAGTWAIVKLLLILVLVLILPIIGYIALSRFLDRMEEPSEQQRVQWENQRAQMERIADPEISGRWTGQEPFFNSGILPDGESMERVLEHWDLAERHVRSAEGLARRGIDDQAVERLHRALNANPNHLGALRLLEEISMRTGAYDTAVSASLRLLEADSRSRASQMRLLTALREAGQADAGLVLVGHMLRTEPNHLDLLETAARFHVQLGAFEDAELLFRRILRLNRENLFALRGMATITSARQEWEQAGEYYRDLLRLEPNDADTYYALALSQAFLGETEEAVDRLSQAISLFGTVPVAGWIRNPGFDQIREEALFRSLADRLVGVEARQAIEELRRRDETDPVLRMPDRFDLPRMPDQRLQPR